VSTSCAQKVESCNDDIKTGNTSGNSSPGIETLSDNLGRVDISNNDVVKMDISDEKLFADPPPKEDCPICMLPMPHTEGICGVTTVYMPCCGKTLCDGCSKAEDEEMKKGNIKQWCSLCRMPLPSLEKERNQQYKKRMNMNDANAFLILGCQYQQGGMGLTQDFSKAVELWNRATELGSVNAHYNLGLV